MLLSLRIDANRCEDVGYYPGVKYPFFGTFSGWFDFAAAGESSRDTLCRRTLDVTLTNRYELMLGSRLLLACSSETGSSALTNNIQQKKEPSAFKRI